MNKERLRTIVLNTVSADSGLAGEIVAPPSRRGFCSLVAGIEQGVKSQPPQFINWMETLCDFAAKMTCYTARGSLESFS